MNRRGFLALTSLALTTAISQLSSAAPNIPRYAALGRTVDGRNYLVLIDHDLKVMHTHPLSQRAHGLSCQDDNLLVVDRRPGTDCHIYNLQQQKVTHQFSAPTGYYFNGHAVMLDGTLWATANRKADSHGVLLAYAGAYKTASSPEIISLGGYGPHQLVAHTGELYCAVGGVKIDFNTGSKSIDEDFHSFIARVDPENRRVSHLITPERSRWLSQRHLCWHQGALYVAGQTLAGAPNSDAYLLRYDPSSGRTKGVPVGISANECDAYLGSIESNGENLYISSPRTGKRWCLSNGLIQPDQTSKDLCALAGSIFFTGLGVIGDTDRKIQLPIQWDNHALSL